MANTNLIVAGSRITAAVIASIAPLAVIKGADQSLASNTTLQNDTALSLAVTAGASYIMICYLDYEGGTQNSSDLKWTWTVPAAATLRYMPGYVSTPGDVVVFGQHTNVAADIIAASTNGAGTLLGAFMAGSLVVGANAGTLQLQWAQNTSSATATIIHAQSWLALWRIT